MQIQTPRVSTFELDDATHAIALPAADGDDRRIQRGVELGEAHGPAHGKCHGSEIGQAVKHRVVVCVSKLNHGAGSEEPAVDAHEQVDAAHRVTRLWQRVSGLPTQAHRGSHTRSACG